MATHRELADEAIHSAAIEAAEINLISKLGLKPYSDGNMWCFLWGEDLQSGIAGFGETVQLAVYDFITNYESQRLLVKNPIRANSPQLEEQPK